jgi:hypothetical protein
MREGYTAAQMKKKPTTTPTTRKKADAKAIEDAKEKKRILAIMDAKASPAEQDKREQVAPAEDTAKPSKKIPIRKEKFVKKTPKEKARAKTPDERLDELLEEIEQKKLKKRQQEASRRDILNLQLLQVKIGIVLQQILVDSMSMLLLMV